MSAALAPLWQTVTSVDEKKQMSKKDLLKYAQGAFDIDDETHNRLMEEVKDEKVQLTIFCIPICKIFAIKKLFVVVRCA